VVSKKVANTAAGRNKIRRRIYDIIRNLKYKSEPVGIFIIIVRPGAKTMSYEALKEEVVGLVGRTDKTR
jgi:ribonuclease P protein component